MYSNLSFAPIISNSGDVFLIDQILVHYVYVLMKTITRNELKITAHNYLHRYRNRHNR